MLSTLVLVAASPLLPATQPDGIVSADMPVHPEASQALIARRPAGRHLADARTARLLAAPPCSRSSRHRHPPPRN